MLFFMLQLVSTASVTICLNAKHSGSIFVAVRQTNSSVHMSGYSVAFVEVDAYFAGPLL